MIINFTKIYDGCEIEAEISCVQARPHMMGYDVDIRSLVRVEFPLVGGGYLEYSDGKLSGDCGVDIELTQEQIVSFEEAMLDKMRKDTDLTSEVIAEYYDAQR